MNQTRTHIIVIITLIASSFASLASEPGAHNRARQLGCQLRNAGWELRDQFNYGRLNPGCSTTLTKTLYAGTSYRFAASGCEDSLDVDIEVYDENWNLVDEDSDDTNLAIADVNPRWDGTFYIKITMHDAHRFGAHYVLQTAYTN